MDVPSLSTFFSPIFTVFQYEKLVTSIELSLTALIILQESPSLPLNKSFSSGQEICFSIRPSLGGRKGWKIMPEAGGDAIEDPGITFTNVLKIILNIVPLDLKFCFSTF